MKLMLDYSGKDNPKDILSIGCFDAIRLNTISILKSGKNLKSIIKDVSDFSSVQVFIDIVSSDVDQIVLEAKSLTRLDSSFCINIPCTKNGLSACRILSNDTTLINIFDCESMSSAFLAYKFGASYVTIDSKSTKENVQLGGDIKLSFNNYPECQTEVLLGNIDSNSDILYAFKNQFDGCFVGYDVFSEIMKNESIEKRSETKFKEYQNITKSNLYS